MLHARFTSTGALGSNILSFGFGNARWVMRFRSLGRTRE